MYTLPFLITQVLRRGRVIGALCQRREDMQGCRDDSVNSD